MSQSPRERLISAAIDLVREYGVEGCSLSELLERSNCARRSIYQNFPGGKLDLIDAATRSVGQLVRTTINRFGATTDTPGLLAELISLASSNLVASDFRLGCPVAAAAAAPPEATAVREAAGAAFDDWIDEIAALLVRDGRTPDEAAALAGFVVSALEGSLLRARALRSTIPLQQAGEYLATLVRHD